MRLNVCLAALLISQAFASAQNTSKLTMEEMHKLHQDSKAYIAMLEDRNVSMIMRHLCLEFSVVSMKLARLAGNITVQNAPGSTIYI